VSLPFFLGFIVFIEMLLSCSLFIWYSDDFYQVAAVLN
jgi:hypothetical protein